MRFVLAVLALLAAVAVIALTPRWALGAGETTPVERTAAAVETTYQGKGVRWWARRAVQARKDANARGRTIKRLQGVARGQLALPTGHWLDGAFLCIHRFEGSWQDDGAPYWGGLQMDMDFVRAHAPQWVIDAFGSNPARWPAAVQMTVAMNAWTTRGFGPWPTTRHFCGL